MDFFMFNPLQAKLQGILYYGKSFQIGHGNKLNLPGRKINIFWGFNGEGVADRYCFF
jgi:hypothetical protein